MLDRKRIADEQTLRSILESSYGPGLFHEVSVNANIPDNPVLERGHGATLSHTGEKWGTTTTTEFYFSDELLLDTKRQTINPLRGIESDVLVHDLHLEEMQACSYTTRFLFGWTRLHDENNPFGNITMEFYVADSHTHPEAIQSVMVICRVGAGLGDTWSDSPRWGERFWGHSPKIPSPRLYLELNVTDGRGEHYKLLCYRLGARLPELNAQGKLIWSEEHQKYDNFDDFVEDRSRYVRTICQRLLQRHEAGVETDVPLGTLLTTDDRCDNLNRRITALRGYQGLEGLEHYSVAGRMGDEHLVLPKSDKPYSVAQAEHRIAEFEQLVGLRDTYSICFERMEDEIRGVCGYLNTENVRFAEIKIPARHSTTGEKTMEVHQFGFTPQGVTDADMWLKEEKAAFDEGVGFIRERFHLQLVDGVLRPIEENKTDA